MTDTLNRAKKLFELGGHLGHRKNRLHPRSRQFVYQIIDGVSIIDLEKTIGQIDEATSTLKQAALDGKKLLVTATKRSLAAQTAALAKDAGAYYITSKWLPGLLTNFNTIQKNVKRLTELKRQKEVGEWGKFVKHEQVALQKEIGKVERLYGGVVNMSKLPDIMLVIDIKREKNAITEAKRSGIPVVAIVDTNCNPDDVLFPVMLNDDTPAAVESVLSELLDVYKKHFAPIVVAPPQKVAPPAVVVAPIEVVIAPAPVAKPVEKVAEVKTEKKPEPAEVKKTPAKKEVTTKKKLAAKAKKSK
jgi:small subunit ribosomal protein S2